jgi:hypothetical protein
MMTVVVPIGGIRVPACPATWSRMRNGVDRCTIATCALPVYGRFGQVVSTAWAAKKIVGIRDGWFVTRVDRVPTTLARVVRSSTVDVVWIFGVEIILEFLRSVQVKLLFGLVGERRKKRKVQRKNIKKNITAIRQRRGR